MEDDWPESTLARKETFDYSTMVIVQHAREYFSDLLNATFLLNENMVEGYCWVAENRNQLDFSLKSVP
jgi:hypothetical protein